MDRAHSVLLPVRGSDIHIATCAVRQDLHVSDRQLPTLLTLQRSKHDLGTAFRAPATDLTVEKRHDVLGQPYRDLRTHNHHDTELGCKPVLVPHQFIPLQPPPLTLPVPGTAGRTSGDCRAVSAPITRCCTTRRRKCPSPLRVASPKIDAQRVGQVMCIGAQVRKHRGQSFGASTAAAGIRDHSVRCPHSADVTIVDLPLRPGTAKPTYD